jgi:hypothetical protein
VSIHDALIRKFPAPEWAIFFEVANGLGLSDRRYADAIAMSLFPSRGLDVNGFEVKTDRGDWLRELKAPQKADAIASYCDFWWLVTSNDKIAPKDEVPKTWGLLVLKDGDLRQVKRAERMKPKKIDRAFMGAMFRRAHQWTETQLKNDERVRAARAEGEKAGREKHTYDIQNNQKELVRLRERVAEFQKASGLNIDTYQAESIGEAVQAFMSFRSRGSVDDMERVAGWIEDTAKGLREKAEAIKKLSPAPSATERVPG